MPSVVLVCDIFFGIGHLSRTLILAAALSKRFRVVVIAVGEAIGEIEAPPGVELHCFPRPAPVDLAGFRSLSSQMVAISAAARPVAVLVEYFPFGRHFGAIYLLPFIKGIRAASEPGLSVICTLRDIQQRKRPGQERFDASAVRMANEYFDRILVHSDPCVTKLEDTFARTAALRIPLEYTHYVSRHAPLTEIPAERSNVILVSAGGGRGGEALLRTAAAAARMGLLRGYTVRILAGALLSAECWEELAASCSGASDCVELHRWAPDLFSQLRNAAVSVSRCGYNTAQDLLAARVPALVIPYVTPVEDEQTERATILARMGLLRMMTEEALTPETLSREIHMTIGFRPAACPVRLDGAERTCEILWSRLHPRPSGG